MYEIKIIELNVRSERVHYIVLVRFHMSILKVLQLLKGISLRLQYLRGNLWSRGNFALSIGFIKLKVIQNFLENQ